MISFILLMAVNGFSQVAGYKVTKKINVLADKSTELDTFSIVPGSVILNDTSGILINTAFYRIDFAKAQLFLMNDSIRLYPSFPCFYITYQTFPFNFNEVFRNKIHIRDTGTNANEIHRILDQYSYEDIETSGNTELMKSGSIYRGISTGNNQDMSVNSGFNLQLSGRLSDDISILASITDKNVPLQPEGNTMQIQEFDKVFIKLMSGKSSLTAGDFEIFQQSSYFLKYHKKAQGGLFSTSFAVNDNKENKSALDINAAIAVAKGKYARNSFRGIEGNQGPYKLTGTNNESYIIVLAGSEKVYLDGVLLKRGKENDYVIDYNTAEITFTPENIITCESRLIVEFEYSERNYARSMLVTDAAYKSKNFKVNLSLYSEQDHKNQPVMQDLTAEQKQILKNSGDNLLSAVVPNVEAVEFSNSENLYKLIDTVAGGIMYDSIYVYSTNADSAKYRLQFTNMGEGNGNYVQLISQVNGKVFKWVAPVNGVPQGTWEPVTTLAAPQKKQMAAISTEVKLSSAVSAGFEAAFSTYDKNTFSDFGNRDNNGVAYKTYITNRMYLSSKKEKSWQLNSLASYEFESKNFNPVERYRSAEYEREWNIFSDDNGEQHSPSFQIEFKHPETGIAGYKLNALFTGNSYSALKHNVYGNLKNKKNSLVFNTGYLDGKNGGTDYKYLKQTGILSRKIGPIRIGVSGLLENNRIVADSNDSLLPQSFAFDEYEIFGESADSGSYYYRVFYKERNDYLSDGFDMDKTTTSNNTGCSFNINKNPYNTVKLTGLYRKLTVYDTLAVNTPSGNTAIARIESNMRVLKKAVSLNTFYETGSGMELKKEFTYVQVDDGKGIYKWTDYNNNNIRELNEFDVAIYKDQADFIRVYTPSNNYIKTHTTQFSGTVNITPSVVLRNKQGFAGFISKLSGISAYSIEHKLNGIYTKNSFNPFVYDVNDSMLVTLMSSFRGTLFYNRSGSGFSADAGYQDSRNKNLLTYGYESRMLEQWEGNFRLNFLHSFTFRLMLLKGYKTSYSEYFPDKDYRILNLSTSPSVAWQPGNTFRLSFLCAYIHRENIIGENHELAFLWKPGVEIRYNTPSKGGLTFKINYINIKYPFEENSSIAYEMTEGLRKGDNVTWNLSYQRNLTEFLQLNFLYDGRSSASLRTVHTGSVQLQAFF